MPKTSIGVCGTPMASAFSVGMTTRAAAPSHFFSKPVTRRYWVTLGLYMDLRYSSAESKPLAAASSSMVVSYHPSGFSTAPRRRDLVRPFKASSILSASMS